MRVTSVRICPVRGNPNLVALADVILDGGLALSDLRLVRKKEGGLCLAYPVSQHSNTGHVRHICNPINRATQEMIEEAVLHEYARVVEVN